MLGRLIDWGYSARSRTPGLAPILSRAYRILRWLHHFRHHVRTSVKEVTYELDLAEDIDSTIYFKGAFEPNTVAAFERLVRPGDVVLDVGANMGWYTLLLARQVQPGGRVIAFEPISWARHKLLRNLALNPNLQNVTVEGLAISSCSRPFQQVSFRASWRPFDRTPGVFTDTVEMVSLDDYLRRSAMSRVDVIKIDVDGHEQQVISGAKDLLRRYKPILVMELGIEALAEAGGSLRELLRMLSELGYVIFNESSGRPFSSYQEIEQNLPSGLTINVVCAHQADARITDWARLAGQGCCT